MAEQAGPVTGIGVNAFRMGHREPQYGHRVWGPCPGCDNWTLETPDPYSNPEIEAAIWEHAFECPALLDNILDTDLSI